MAGFDADQPKQLDQVLLINKMRGFILTLILPLTLLTGCARSTLIVNAKNLPGAEWIALKAAKLHSTLACNHAPMNEQRSVKSIKNNADISISLVQHCSR